MVVNYNVSPSYHSPYQVRINFGQKFPQKNKEHPIQNAPYIFFIKTCQRHLIYNHLCR